MATDIQVVIDCADPDRLAHFWADALHYKLQDPPDGFASWHEWLRDRNVPESEWNSVSAVIDPEGKRPRIYFQRVPEPKTVKNRVHLDLNASAGVDGLDAKRSVVDAEVSRLNALGATTQRSRTGRGGEYWVVMQDPEGNEFCVQ